MNYYNEIDPFCCDWLENLIEAGEIPAGHVDRRSIEEVTADDVRDYTQCHWFAGLGGWAYALRLAGWPDDRPVWSASCPCQPFSAAGRSGLERDGRHLWPSLYRIVHDYDQFEDRGLPVLFGEQVSSADGRAWMSAVRHDLDLLGHAVGCVDTCAAGAGAPHIRQRLYWVADPDPERQQEHQESDLQPLGPRLAAQRRLDAAGRRDPERLADAERAKQGSRVQVIEGQQGLWGDRLTDSGEGDGRVADTLGEPVRAEGHRPDDGEAGGVQGEGLQRQRLRPDAGDGGGGVGDPEPEGLQGLRGDVVRIHEPGREQAGEDRPVAPADLWTRLLPIPCGDGKIRFTGPGVSPLAHGIPRSVGPELAGLESVDIRTARTNRVGRLRAYGNAIVPQLAARFIIAAAEAIDLRRDPRHGAL